jgi:hypothetical protein
MVDTMPNGLKSLWKVAPAGFKGRVQVTTDGHRHTWRRPEGAFRLDCDYAKLQGIYGALPAEERYRYSPCYCIDCDMRVLSGDVDPKHLRSTSCVERHNLTMRLSMRRFARLTNSLLRKSRITVQRSRSMRYITILPESTSRCESGLAWWLA